MVQFYSKEIFPVFLLIFVRIIGLTISSPIFSSSLIPRRVVLLLTFSFSIVIFSLVYKNYKGLMIEDTTYRYFLYLLNEFLIGVSIGLFINIIFTSFQLAAQFFSFQMGLGISQVVDPLSEIQAPVMAQFFSVFATFVFISINGLEYIIITIKKSFEVVGFVNIASKVSYMYPDVVKLIKEFFIIALQIAIPIMATLLVVNIILGIISKFAPQINIFMIGLNIEVMVGFIILLMYIPFLTGLTKTIFDNLFINILKWINLLA